MNKANQTETNKEIKIKNVGKLEKAVGLYLLSLIPSLVALVYSTKIENYQMQIMSTMYYYTAYLLPIVKICLDKNKQ